MCQVHFSSAAGGKHMTEPPTFLWHLTAPLCDRQLRHNMHLNNAVILCDAEAEVIVERHVDGVQLVHLPNYPSIK